MGKTIPTTYMYCDRHNWYVPATPSVYYPPIHNDTCAPSAIVKPTKAAMFLEFESYPPSGGMDRGSPHKNGALVVFFDGHVKQMQYANDLTDNILYWGWGCPYEPSVL